jgi:hypothetical protein
MTQSQCPIFLFFLILLIYFSKFWYTGHEPISVTNFGWRVNVVKVLIPSCLQNLFFLNLGFGGFGEAAARQPPPPWWRPWFNSMFPCSFVRVSFYTLFIVDSSTRHRCDSLQHTIGESWLVRRKPSSENAKVLLR